ncbi:hypothetical protein STEG23_012174 [Scotinomys teguina]
MQPGQTTNNGGGTMEVVAAAPRCQLLLIMLMTVMLLPGMKVSPLLVWRKIASTIKLQENIGKGKWMELENILSEETQTQKDKHGTAAIYICIYSFIGFSNFHANDPVS